MAPWAEVRGTVRECSAEGQLTRVLLDEDGDVISIRVSRDLASRVKVGFRIAILRTDGMPAHVVRSLD